MSCSAPPIWQGHWGASGIWLIRTDRRMPKVALGALVELLKYEARPGEGLAGVVWQTGEPIIVEDYDNWPGRIPNYGHNLIRSIIGVPLLVGSQVRGVLALANDVNTEGTFGPETVEVLTQFARLAAVAIENARLFSRAEQELASANERKKPCADMRNGWRPSIAWTASSRSGLDLSPDLRYLCERTARAWPIGSNLHRAAERDGRPVAGHPVVDSTSTGDFARRMEIDGRIGSMSGS